MEQNPVERTRVFPRGQYLALAVVFRILAALAGIAAISGLFFYRPLITSYLIPLARMISTDGTIGSTVSGAIGRLFWMMDFGLIIFTAVMVWFLRWWAKLGVRAAAEPVSSVPSSPGKWPLSDKLFVLACIGTFLLLTLPTLPGSFSVDELSMVTVFQGPVTFEKLLIFRGEEHPLALRITNFMLPLSGGKEWIMRLPFLAVTAAGIPVFFALMRRIVGRYVARVAIALLAINFFLVMCGPTLRAYAFVHTFGLASSLAFLCLLRREGKGDFASGASLALFSALGIYAQPLFVFVNFTQILFLFLFSRRYPAAVVVKAFFWILSGFLLAAALYGPLYPFTFAYKLISTSTAAHDLTWGRAVSFLLVGKMAGWPGIIFTVIFTLGFLIPFLKGFRVLEFGYLVLFMCSAFLVVWLIPYGFSRYVLFFLPTALCGVALFIVRFSHAFPYPRRRFLVVVLVCLYFLVQLPAYTKFWRLPGLEDLRGTAVLVTSSASARDKVYQLGIVPQPLVQYYFRDRHVEASAVKIRAMLQESFAFGESAWVVVPYSACMSTRYNSAEQVELYRQVKLRGILVASRVSVDQPTEIYRIFGQP